MTLSSNKKITQHLPHQILIGKTWHARYKPSKHSFSYPYRYWGLSLNRLADADFPVNTGLFSKKDNKNGKLFTTNGKGLHSFDFADYFDLERLDETNKTNAQYQQEQLLAKNEAAIEPTTETTAEPTKETTKPVEQNQEMDNKQKAQAWLAKVQQEFQRLTNSQPTGDILALVVSRNLGVYFSPVNFYLGFDDEGNTSHLLAEVSNTPWDKSHFYGFKLDGNEIKNDTGRPNEWEFSHNKDFHVSPFNPIDQVYTWKVKIDNKVLHLDRDKLGGISHYLLEENTQKLSGLKNINLSIHVSDGRGKVFVAGINMKSQAMTASNLRQTIRKNPLMNYSSMWRIYWHAFILFVRKKVPYVDYNQKLADSKQNSKNEINK